jgi:hypothetical protein
VFEDVSQFKIPVHDFGLDQGLEGVEDLNEVLEGFFLGELLLGLESSHEVALVAILQHQVDVVDSLLYVDKSHDIVILAAPKNLNLVVQQFCKFS